MYGAYVYLPIYLPMLLFFHPPTIAVRYHLPPSHLRLVGRLPRHQARVHPDLLTPDLRAYLLHQRLCLRASLQATGREKLDVEYRHCCSCLSGAPGRGVVVSKFSGLEPGIDGGSTGGHDFHYSGLVYVCLHTSKCGGGHCGEEHGGRV